VGARSKARKRALDVLYESDMRGTGAAATLAERLAQSDPPVPAYAVELVQGVTGRLGEIDALISEYAVDWTLERMPAVDRNVLRVGVYELLWRDDIPDRVAIDEAVELAKRLSTDASPGFVNGVLSRLYDLKPGLVAKPR
jgi:transcription antitermination protein NusB